MKLEADHARRAAHDRGKSIAFVRAPRGDAALVGRATHVAVGVVSALERIVSQQRLASSVERIPSDLRDAPRPQPLDATTQHAEPGTVTFVAGVEEQLHAEADA